jgi:hypothetical protein
MTRTRDVRTADIETSLLSASERRAVIVAVLDYSIELIGRLEVYSRVWPDDRDALETFVDKVVAETALLVLLATRLNSGGQAIKLRTERLASALSPYARSERNAAMMLRFPHSVSTLAFAHIALQRAGYCDDNYDSLVRRCFAAEQVECIERVPFRSMELLWQRELIQTIDEVDYSKFLSSSILCSSPNPCHSIREQGYQYTHAVMYVTDFGFKARRLSAFREQIGNVLDEFLAWTSMSEDFDLTCELLMASECAGLGWSPATRLAAEQVWAVWSEKGYLPGINYDERSHCRIVGDVESQAYAARHIYHTNYVLGLLCILIDMKCTRNTGRHVDSRCWCPPDAGQYRGPTDLRLAILCDETVSAAQQFLTRRAANSFGAFDAVLRKEHYQIDNPYPFATSQLAPLPESMLVAISRTAACERCLKAFLIARASLGAIRSYDLVRVCLILADLVAHELPPISAVRSVVEFLARQQLPGGAIGAYFLGDENERSEAALIMTNLFARTLAMCAEYFRPGT